MAEKVKVRDGGRYRTRDGKVVTMRPDSAKPDYPWRGDDGWSRTDGGCLWHTGTKHPDDLVEELPIEQPEAVEEASEPIRAIVNGCHVVRGTEEIASVGFLGCGSIFLLETTEREVAFTADEWDAIITAINKLRNQ
jgi:hypothetical protein